MLYQVRNKKGTILSEHIFAQPPVSATLTASSPTLPPTVIDLTPFNLAKGEELRVYSLCNQHGYWVGTISVA
jgi:desulfoferrodoxin (superoxide reductase-like protein)